jgi:hypothetical protein
MPILQVHPCQPAFRQFIYTLMGQTVGGRAVVPLLEELIPGCC